MKHLLSCLGALALALLLGEASSNTAENDPNEPELSTEEWNEKYCTIKGCKPATDSLMLLSKLNKHARDDIIKRNTLVDPLYTLPKDMQPLDDAPDVRYLGVTLDAARHYFPIDWIRNLLQILSIMKYNLLHLRLTDDQAFNVRLESVPQLANPASNNTQEIYTAQDLKDLVAYADTLGIIIVPEIDVPGHAGGWLGMVMPCPNTICTQASAVPLNLPNPSVTSTVHSVLKEIHQIFHTSPFLHLGGHEVHLGVECVEEANFMTRFPNDYQRFETGLRQLAKDELNDVQIVRWEASTAHHVADESMEAIANVNRTADVIHYRLHNNNANEDASKGGGEESPELVFSSNGLNFANDQQATGFQIYAATRATIHRQSASKIAVIAATLDLGIQQWFDRNVIGRLLAVALGASSRMNPSSQAEFDSTYERLCKDHLHFDNSLCELHGAPALSEFLFRGEWQDIQAKYPQMICDRHTMRTSVLQLQGRSWQKKQSASNAMAIFWHYYGETPEFAATALPATPIIDSKFEFFESLRNHSRVPHTGLVLDLVRIDCDEKSMARIMETLDLMHTLGFNTLQLRIMSDLGFVIEVPQHYDLMWGSDRPYSEKHIQQIVEYATSLNIQIIPELSTATRGGGWFAAGLIAACPNTICETGVGIGADVEDHDLFGVIVSVIHQLMEQFRNPPYVHLGYDERDEAKRCYHEAGLSPDLDEFEQKLLKTVNFQNFDTSKLIRYENAEGVAYPHRVGEVTHYRLTTPAERSKKQMPYFLSSGLNFADPEMQTADLWTVYQHTRTLASFSPMGIIAVVDLVHNIYWNDFAVAQRLLVVAMALSPLHRTKTEFHEQVKQALSLLKIEGDPEGALEGTAQAYQRLKYHWDARIVRACSECTLKVPKLLPKLDSAHTASD